MIFDNGVKANQQGKDSLFNKRYQENWTSLSIRMKLDPSVTLCNSKLIKDLNPRSKIQDQHLINSRRKHRAKTSQHGIQQWSLSYNTKGTENKRKINKLDFMKKFQTVMHQRRVSKDNIIKKKPSELEKIFTNHVSDNGLMSGIYRELLKPNNKNKYSI